MKHKIYCTSSFQIKAKDIALNSLFNLFPINFTWLDNEGYVIGCNQHMINFLNLSGSESLIGKHASSFFSKNAWENSQKVIKTGNPIITEETHIYEGKKIYFLSMKSPLKDCNGKTIGLVNIAIDITERKVMEQELCKLKEAAELSDQFKTDFLINMRHDLKTPISGIITISEFLENIEETPNKKNYLKNIKECATSMLNYFNEILEFSKINTDKDFLIESEFDIHDILKSIYHMSFPLANSKGLEFNFHIKNIPCKLISNSARIQRIFINLISNSIKFTEKGHVKIFVNWQYLSNKKGILEFIVDDSGIGIPEDKKNIIFEKFYRIDPSYSGNYSGSGLGLNIVKKFIEDLDGDYEITSVLGEGTIFKVIIPCKVPVIEINYSESLSTTTEDLSTICKLNYIQESYKILFVEDNKIISQISKDLLESLNCKVDLAETGTKAIELADQYDYDLIILDIGLPDMNGYDIAKKVRLNKNKAISEAPIIALTAHSDNQEKIKCLEVGINQMITKPLTKEIAKTILYQFLSKKHT